MWNQWQGVCHLFINKNGKVMGMIANYQYINDEQLNFLKSSDSKENDVLEEVEEMVEEETDISSYSIKLKLI